MDTLLKTRTDLAGTVEADADWTSLAPTGVRIAYLLSRYPAISHTFFLHEVLGLRARGLHIETASINRPDRPIDQLPPTEADEARTTYYIKGGSMLQAASRLLRIMLLHPMVVLRGLGAVFAVRNLTLRARGFWSFYLAEALLVGAWMAERKLGHLHVHFGGPVAAVGMLTAKAWQVPFSLTIHGPEELLDVEANHLREKVECAHFVFCISDFCRSQLCQATSPAHWAKYHVVRLGVDPAELVPQPRARVDGAPLSLLCIGRLVPAKGHRVLLEAVRLLQDENILLHVTLVGSGPEFDGLRALTAQHGLDAAVTFTQALSHDAALNRVRQADIFALASFAEGVPVALMEAMALEVPCVSTWVAGIPELIRDGVDGLLVPPGNAESLAEALAALIRDADLRRNLGVAARQRVIRDYNLPLNQELLAGAFQTLTARRPS